jgi:hypothetical protein
MLSRINHCQLVILLLSVEFSTVSCDTFYIVTSPSSPCPGEYIGVPCLTLQQYASNPSRSQNITFIIEPGMYNLSTVLTVSDGYNFTMSSTNATVTCTSATAKFEFRKCSWKINVHISGMTLQGCRSTAISMSRITSASIMNALECRQWPSPPSAWLQVSCTCIACGCDHNINNIYPYACSTGWYVSCRSRLDS